MQKVARNTTSYQKVGEQLVESSREKGEWGRGGRLLLSPKRYRDDSINTTYFNTIDSYSSHE